MNLVYTTNTNDDMITNPREKAERFYLYQKQGTMIVQDNWFASRYCTKQDLQYTKKQGTIVRFYYRIIIDYILDNEYR